MAKKPRWKGGAKLRRFRREVEAAARKEHVIEVGFRDRRMNALAALLEFGNPETNLPERPAFRLGVQEMVDVVRAWFVKTYGSRVDLASGRRGLTRGQAIELAVLARDTIRRAYADFHGQPLSERQKARKAGTEYADEQLIGHEGPKLIGHVRVYVDGNEVG